MNETRYLFKNAYKANTIVLFSALRTHISSQIPIYMWKIGTENGTYSTDIRTLQTEISNEVTACHLINSDLVDNDGVHMTIAGTLQFANAVNALL